MKKTVAFYIESMVVGGAEKVLIDLANNLNPNKYEVTVIALFKKSIYSDYCFEFEEKLRPHVNYKYLIDNTNILRYRLFNYLYAHIPKSIMYGHLIKDKFDVEVAFYEGWPTEFVSYSSQNSYKIAWLHTDQQCLYQKLTKDQLDNKKRLYQSFNRIVGVSKAVCQSFKVIFPDYEPNCVYNPFDEELIRAKAEVEKIPRQDLVQFVTVGRLIAVKGYERLISVFAECKRQGLSFGLWMIGDGENRDQLKSMVERYNLEKEVTFLGQKANPYPYIKAADCLISSSYVEGLSTVVIEAIVLGKPVITTDCSGMQEIFGTSECGYICENSEKGLLQGIKYVLDKPKNLDYYRKQAQQRNVFFALKKRMNDIEDLLDNNFS